MDGPTVYFFFPEQKARSHASEAASSFIMQAQYTYHDSDILVPIFFAELV